MTPRILSIVVSLCLPACLGAAEMSVELRDRVEDFLGGPCETAAEDADYGRRTRAMREEISAAKHRGEYAAAVDLQKARMRERCHDNRSWSHLASLLLKSGQEKAAVTALEVAFELGSNDIDYHLRGDWTGLDALRESDLLLRSPLTTKLERSHAAHDARLTAARERLATLPRPELPYVTRDICPFECCGFGEWTVDDDTPLYAAIDASVVVGTADAGTTAEALTGHVYVTEVLPILAVYPHEVDAADGTPREKLPVEAGDFVFLLHYIGEGYSYAWHDNRVVSIESEEARSHCPHPASDCWGEHLAPLGKQSEPVWWVEIRLADATTGWTRQTSNFSGMDGCS